MTTQPPCAPPTSVSSAPPPASLASGAASAPASRGKRWFAILTTYGKVVPVIAATLAIPNHSFSLSDRFGRKQVDEARRMPSWLTLSVLTPIHADRSVKPPNGDSANEEHPAPVNNQKRPTSTPAKQPPPAPRSEPARPANTDNTDAEPPCGQLYRVRPLEALPEKCRARFDLADTRAAEREKPITRVPNPDRGGAASYSFPSGGNR
jgi:hypothetical protein